MGIKWLVPQCARLETEMVGGIGPGDIRGIAWVMNYMYVARYGIYVLKRYCKTDKAGRGLDTDHHSVVSLSLIRNTKPLALLAILRFLQSLDHQLRTARVRG